MCGLTNNGEAAHREMQVMLGEANKNLPRARLGQPSKYRQGGRFYLKILPDVVREFASVAERVESRRQKEKKADYFTRSEFANGAAGNFYCQACALVGGMGRLPQDFDVIPPLEDLLERFPSQASTENEEDGRRMVSVQGPLELSEHEVAKNVGTTLLTTLLAAFSCELVMKAILMTRTNEFRRTHDLKDLYDTLPSDCRERLEADFHRISEVLSERREAFGKWRYFHPGENPAAINNLIESDGARDLAKAARVLIDEGWIAGLIYNIQVGPEILYQIDDDGLEQRFGTVTITGSESEIDWDSFRQDI